MTFTRLVDARKDRIYNTERRAASDASARSTLSGTHRPVGVGGGFKRPDDAGPNRDDAPRPRLRGLDRRRARMRNAIEFVEGESPIEVSITRRRQTGRV